MKYKAGDRVRVHNRKWFEDNCTKGIFGDYTMSEGVLFTTDMLDLCGQVVTIAYVGSDYYRIKECSFTYWYDDMFIELVEDAKKINRDIGDSNIIEHICKLLGIEVGQVIINRCTGRKYRFSNEQGFEVYNEKGGYWEVNITYPFPYALKAFATNQFTTKWTPKDGDIVYFVSFAYASGYDFSCFNSNNSHHQKMLENNMLYKTKEEAMRAAKTYMEQMKEGE